MAWDLSAAPSQGPRPTPFVFPFDLVGPTVESLELMRERLSSLKSSHVSAFGGMNVKFEGSTADAFEAAFNDGMEAVERGRWSIWGQIGAIEDLLARATALHAAREAAIAEWDAANANYQPAQAAAHAATL